MKKSTSKKGFTLVELVIVIAVIAILSAILIPTFGNVIADAKEKKMYANAKGEMEVFYTSQQADNGFTYDSALVLYYDGTVNVSNPADKVYKCDNGANLEEATDSWPGVVGVFIKDKKLDNVKVSLASDNPTEYTAYETNAENVLCYKVGEHLVVVFFKAK